MKSFYTYVLECADGKRYSGQTYDLERRLEDHRRGEIRATRLRLPVRLVRFDVYPTPSEVKGWKREAQRGVSQVVLESEALEPAEALPGHVSGRRSDAVPHSDRHDTRSRGAMC